MCDTQISKITVLEDLKLKNQLLSNQESLATLPLLIGNPEGVLLVFQLIGQAA